MWVSCGLHIRNVSSSGSVSEAEQATWGELLSSTDGARGGDQSAPVPFHLHRGTKASFPATLPNQKELAAKLFLKPLARSPGP